MSLLMLFPGMPLQSFVCGGSSAQTRGARYAMLRRWVRGSTLVLLPLASSCSNGHSSPNGAAIPDGRDIGGNAPPPSPLGGSTSGSAYEPDAGSASSDAAKPDIWQKPTTGFVTQQRIQYSDGLHNENTDLIRWGDKTYLVFRGGEASQIGSPTARLKIWESSDAGDTWSMTAEVFMQNRDVRDPKFVLENNKLAIYAISRVPGVHVRDAGGLAWTVRTETTDGRTFTPAVRVYDETWGFWRFARHNGTLYATGYNDGDTQVGFFSSPDGVSWTKISPIYDVANDAPSEAELQFFGDTAVSLVRLDNGTTLLDDGQTAVCVAQVPYASWDCNRKLDKRLDGPNWFSHNGHQYVIARKHLSGTRKRTAVYELLGDLTTPSSPITLNELFELKSSGDTAYVGVMPLSGDQFLVSWYSTNVQTDPPWLSGMLGPTDIWLTWLDLSKIGQ
jgi:hypothetical protein